MGLFGEPRVEGEERERCLAYQDEMSKLSAFLSHESRQFTHTWGKYVTSIPVNQAAAGQLHKAANRLVQAAQEAIRRHEAIQPVPDAALRIREAESLFLLRFKEWAEGTMVATEDLVNGLTPDAIKALARGLPPRHEYLQHLVHQYESACRKVGEENKRFLKRLKLTASEEFEMSFRDDMNLSAAGCRGSWQPEPYTHDFSEVVETPQQT